MSNPHTRFIKVIPLVLGLVSASVTHAQQANATPGDLKWVDAPASLPAGAKLGIVQGDLGKPGALTFRLKLPAGYKFMPHSSPAIDRIVVVSGTFNLGSGAAFDSARTIPLSTGYVHWPSKSPYFAWAKDETIIELQGVGPWAVKYVNQGDDPTKAR